LQARPLGLDATDFIAKDLLASCLLGDSGHCG
jgi:hypothetical protein